MCPARGDEISYRVFGLRQCVRSTDRERRRSAVDQAQVDRERRHTLRHRTTKAGLLGSLRDHEQVAWERNIG